MNDEEFWQIAYLISMARGDKDPIRKANKAVKDIKKTFDGDSKVSVTKVST